MIRGVPHHLPNMVAVTLWHGMVWYGMVWLLVKLDHWCFLMMQVLIEEAG